MKSVLRKLRAWITGARDRPSGVAYSPEQVIGALYGAALGRDPDEASERYYASRLRSEPSALPSVAREFHDSEEHRSRATWREGLTDHSQYGEFPILLRQLLRIGQRHGIVVDVGARGRERSNAYDLMSQFDWRGLLIEANPRLLPVIEREFTGTHFDLVGCAVGLEEGEAPFFIGDNDDVSSLLADHAAGWGPLKGEVRVAVRRLEPILVEADIPLDFDVLSLDIEGMDMAVLNQLIDASAYRPRLIVIEASYGFATKTLADVRASLGVQDAYKIVGQTEANLILRHRAI